MGNGIFYARSESSRIHIRDDEACSIVFSLSVGFMV